MQHTRYPNFPPLNSSFKSHRSSIDHTRFQLDLTLTKPVARPDWAALPTPPMSGSPPPEHPVEPSQTAGRRRKRSDTPPTTTVASIPLPPTPIEHTPHRPFPQARTGYSQDEGHLQSVSYAPYPPPPLYPLGGSLPQGPMVMHEAPSLAGQVSPRATRKTKAHVASACVNCKKKHLRCDSSRPCQRCMQTGKEDTCHDVEHKKRGRPPLKPEDHSIRRPFESAISPVTGPMHESVRRMTTSEPSAYSSAPYQRAIRPIPPLAPYDANRLARPSQPHPQMYAPPSVSSSTATAMGTFVPPSRQHSQSQPIGLHQAPSNYMPAGPDSSLQQQQGYQSAYSYPPLAPSQLNQQQYSNPIFPRLPAPTTHVEMPPMNVSASLQLPPIRPAPRPSPTDSAISYSARTPTSMPPQLTPRTSDDSDRQPGAKRPKMDIQGILGPRHD